jgi:CBS domain-containing protein
MIAAASLGRVPPDARSELPVTRLMRPMHESAELRPDDAGEAALDRLERAAGHEVPVVDHGRFLGLVRLSDLLRFTSLRRRRMGAR